mgnify:CR=1 FL=1
MAKNRINELLFLFFEKSLNIDKTNAKKLQVQDTVTNNDENRNQKTKKPKKILHSGDQRSRYLDNTGNDYRI